MKKNIHPKIHIVKVTHTDDSTYDIVSIIKSNELKVSATKDRYPWKEHGQQTIQTNDKTKKFDLFGSML